MGVPPLWRSPPPLPLPPGTSMPAPLLVPSPTQERARWPERVPPTGGRAWPGLDLWPGNEWLPTGGFLLSALLNPPPTSATCGLVLHLATSCGRTKLFATAPDGGRGMVRLRAGSLTLQHPPSQHVTTCRIFQDRLEQEYSRISRNVLNMCQTTGPQFMSPSPHRLMFLQKKSLD